MSGESSPDARRLSCGVAAVKIGGSDLGMIIGPRPIGTDLQLLPFGEPAGAGGAGGHRLANRTAVDFSEIHDERFIQLTRPNHIRMATDAMMANHGVRPALMHEVSTQRTLVELVRRGEGVGLADLEMIHSCAGEVVPIAVEPSASWPIERCWGSGRVEDGDGVIGPSDQLPFRT